MKHIFSTSFTDLGNCDLVKHKINLTDDQPIKVTPRRIPPALYTEVKEHLVEMIEAGAVRPSHSPYSSNIVLARKKDGSLRFCVDFPKLNNKTVKDAYAIPRIEESLHLLAGAKYFSKLDLRSGYWQVEMKKRIRRRQLSRWVAWDSMSSIECLLDCAMPQLRFRDSWNGIWGI